MRLYGSTTSYKCNLTEMCICSSLQVVQRYSKSKNVLAIRGSADYGKTSLSFHMNPTTYLTSIPLCSLTVPHRIRSGLSPLALTPSALHPPLANSVAPAACYQIRVLVPCTPTHTSHVHRVKVEVEVRMKVNVKLKD